MAEKISRFTPKVLRELATEIEKATADVAERHGVSIHYVKGKYAPGDADLTFHVSLDGVDPAKSDFDQFCTAFGLSKEDYGKTVSVFGDTFEIVGLSPKATKNVVIGKKLTNGKRYRLPLAEVQRALEPA